MKRKLLEQIPPTWMMDATDAFARAEALDVFCEARKRGLSQLDAEGLATAVYDRVWRKFVAARKRAIEEDVRVGEQRA